MQPDQVETPQLILRALTAEDAPTLFQVYQTEGLLQYFPGSSVPSLEKIERFISVNQTHWDQHGYGNWGIVPRGQEAVIGWAGLYYLPELEETEVGFLLDQPFWGRGYATEAGRASLAFGFERFGFDHIIALVHPENLASRRVIEKLGMAYVETIDLWGSRLMRHRLDRTEATTP